MLEIVVIVLGVGIMALIVWLGVRHAASTRELLNRTIREHNAALVALAAEQGLVLVPGAAYEHPMMGSYEALSRVTGTLEGLGVDLTSENLGDSEHSVYSTRLRLVGPGSTFGDGTARTSFALPRQQERLAALLPAGSAAREGLAGLEEQFEKVELGEHAIAFVLRPPPKWPRRMSLELRMVSDPERLRRALREGLALARALFARQG